LIIKSNIVFSYSISQCLLGQGDRVHVADDVELPGQLLPPPDGGGLLQDLERDFDPLAHVTEQAPYDPQDPHFPSTEIDKKICN
jgi:hypothetical protein